MWYTQLDLYSNRNPGSFLNHFWRAAQPAETIALFSHVLQGEAAELGTEAVLRLEQERQAFVLTEVPEQPVLSVLRGFSAPVKLEVDGQTEEDLVFLLGHDTDSFSKWEAGQTLQRTLLLELYNAAADESKVGGILCLTGSTGSD